MDNEGESERAWQSSAPKDLKRRARELLDHGRPSEAQELLERAARQEPNDAATLGLLLKAARAQGRHEDELVYCRLFRRHFPDRPTPQLRLLNLLEAQQSPEAEGLARDLRQRFPERPEPLATLARLAERDKRFAETSKLAAALVGQSPASVQGWRMLVRAQGSLGRPDLAWEACRDGIVATGDWKIEADYIRVLLKQGAAREALDTAAICREKYPDVPALRVLHARASAMAGDGDAALRVVREGVDEHPDNPALLCELASLYIERGMDGEARATIARVVRAGHRSPHALRLRLWAMAKRGGAPGARRIRRKARVGEDVTALQAPTDPPRLISRAGLLSAAREIRLSVLQRNQLERLPYFLEYYRAIGVERFVFIDNGSEDGSVDFLLGQPDVVLFSAPGSFSATASGMQWVNWVMDQYRDDCWWLHADADEYLVLPYLEENDLSFYLRYLEKSRGEVVGAFMLDMFPPTISRGARYRSGQDPLEVAPYFDTDYTFRNAEAPPFFAVDGGFRRRLTSADSGVTEAPLLTKSAITRNVRYVNSHSVTPGRVSALTGAFLHFKFIGDFAAEITAEVKRGEHYKAAVHYQSLDRAFARLSDGASLLGKSSVAYGGSRQLLDLGFISAPTDLQPPVDPY